MNKKELKDLFMDCLLEARNEAEEEAEEEKKKDDEEKEAKNDIVDKRDIIRQIMAIAGKHEDNEDVRTIAKLAEKLAYDKSEADRKADNKCKNEEEEEEKEDYKEKFEELKAKMEADEKKKEAENKKAKNAIEDQKALFTQGSISQKSSYISKKAAIELGNELY